MLQLDIVRSIDGAHCTTPLSHTHNPLLMMMIIISSHSGVETHFDGSDFTWSLMLSPREQYEGGGTYIRCLQQTLRLQQGQVLLHPGALFHAGADITAGCREYVCCWLLVCIIELLLCCCVVLASKLTLYYFLSSTRPQTPRVLHGWFPLQRRRPVRTGCGSCPCHGPSRTGVDVAS